MQPATTSSSWAPGRSVAYTPGWRGHFSFDFLSPVRDSGGRFGELGGSLGWRKEENSASGSVEVILQKGAASRESILGEVRTLVATSARRRKES